MTTKTYTLIDPDSGSETKLPVLTGTTGPSVIDVTKIYASTGAFTFDPGFAATASCVSTVT